MDKGLNLKEIQKDLDIRIEHLQGHLREKIGRKNVLEKELESIQIEITAIQSNLSDAKDLLKLSQLVGGQMQRPSGEHTIEERVNEAIKLVGLSKGDAALEILRQEGKPLTTSQITEKLKESGMRFGDNEYNIMYTALKRKEKDGRVERVKDVHSNEVRWFLAD